MLAALLHIARLYLRDIHMDSRTAASCFAAGLATAAAVAYGAWLYKTRPRKATDAVGAGWKRVLVASTSKVKVDAVSRALACKAVGMDVPSMVADQPMGLDETVRGAKNRMGALLESAKDGDDAAIAIESGIVRMLHQTMNSEETWVDIAVVVVHDLSTGAESVATTAGVQFPAEAVGRWAEDGSEGTVGEVIGEDTGCDQQDPHTHLTKQTFSRSDLLEQAIRIAMSTMSRPDEDLSAV